MQFIYFFLLVLFRIMMNMSLKWKLPAKLTLTEDTRSIMPAASPCPSPSAVSAPQSARGTGASKWGRILGSSSVDSASDTCTKVAVSRSLSARESLRETSQSRQSSGSTSNGGQGNKVNIFGVFYWNTFVFVVEFSEQIYFI